MTLLLSVISAQKATALMKEARGKKRPKPGSLAQKTSVANIIKAERMALVCAYTYTQVHFC